MKVGQRLARADTVSRISHNSWRRKHFFSVSAAYFTRATTEFGMTWECLGSCGTCMDLVDEAIS